MRYNITPRPEQEFLPIELTIVVESKKELNYLCAALNVSGAKVADEHSCLEVKDLDSNSSMELWRELERLRVEGQG